MSTVHRRREQQRSGLLGFRRGPSAEAALCLWCIPKPRYMPAFQLCVAASFHTGLHITGEIGLLGEQDPVAASLTTPGKLVHQSEHAGG